MKEPRNYSPRCLGLCFLVSSLTMTSTALLESSVEEYASQIKVQTDLVLEAANGLPKDIRFHRSLDGKFKKDLDTATARVLRLTNRLLKLVETVSTKPTDLKAQRRRAEDRRREDFEDEQDVIDRFHSGAVDLMDPLFERVDHCLDIHHGKAKSTLPSKTVDAIPQGSARLPHHLLHAYKLAKPQLQFRDKVNNDENTLWTHKVAQKWHDKGSKSTDDTSGVAP
ncbi:exosome nuclease subunit, partial [Serendipita sp. 401]